MEHTELSLGQPQSISTEETDPISTTKRKQQSIWSNPVNQSGNIDLQLDDPLPLNRRTMKKRWMRPKERSMDLDLNISVFPFSEGKTTYTAQEMKKQCSSSSNMVALVCVHCHLLVMMFKSSPHCPNCNYLHSLPLQDVSHHNLEAAKPLETLNLLH